MIIFFLSFFLFGLVIGSFLNVVVARTHSLETLLGRSYCRSCRAIIRWFDNIPLLSFLLLRGKCRRCRSAISWRYPFVELSTGILFALVGWKFFDVSNTTSWVETILYLWVVCFALVIALYDARHYEIPMHLLWAMVVVVLGHIVVLDIINFSASVLWWDVLLYKHLIASAVAFGTFYVLSAVSKERWMGYGDAYVVLAIGLSIGFGVFGAIMLGSIVGALYGVANIFLSRKTLASQIPFAPFLCIGMGIMLFLGDELARFAPLVFWE